MHSVKSLNMPSTEKKYTQNCTRTLGVNTLSDKQVSQYIGK